MVEKAEGVARRVRVERARSRPAEHRSPVQVVEGA